MTLRLARRARGALALAAAIGTQLAAPHLAGAELPGGGRAYFLGPECRIRAEGPLDCDEVTSVRGLVGGTSPVQMVVEAGTEPLDLIIGGSVPCEQIFVPVTTRSRGVDPSAALPWSAAARPADDTVLGRVADPLGLPAFGGATRLSASPEARARLLPGERRAWWMSFHHQTAERPRRTAQGIAEPEGGPELEIITLARAMPPPVVSVFAYLERDEPLLPRGGARREDGSLERTGAQAVADILSGHQVQPIDRATSVEELAIQLREVPIDRFAQRDLVVLGAYGTLGEPTGDAVARAVAMAREIPASVRDVVLYAVDEDCDSDLPARWRARLRAEGSDAARRIRVLVTCGEDPRGVDADIVMMPAERFRPREVNAARATGKDVWVYNGRLPQAGPMALDAPPESLMWLGWIAARYDVRRWFLWNVNHWSDGNRGGHGPRDAYADPETFHNADGDAVLYDGVLFLPPRPPGRHVATTVRLARLQRGIEDAALLGLAASIDPEGARAALDLVVPRALGDVRDDEAAPFGDGRAIARARSQLLDIIAQDASTSPVSVREEEGVALEEASRRASAGIAALRATIAAHAELAAPPSRSPARWQRRQTFAAAVVASCLGGAAIAAWRLARRRRSERREHEQRRSQRP